METEAQRKTLPINFSWFSDVNSILNVQKFLNVINKERILMQEGKNVKSMTRSLEV